MSQLDHGTAARGSLAVGAGLATLECGDVGAPAVLLVPGYTGTKEDFAPILSPLADAGLRAVAIDLPGQYQSPGWAAPEDYTVDRLGAVVLAACHALGPRVRLVGHSFGGLVSRSAVLAEPTAVDSLVLLSSGPDALGGTRRSMIELAEPILADRGLAGVYDALQAVTPPDPAVPAELTAFFAERFLAGSPAMLAGMGVAIRTEPDRVAELAATGVRTLVVHGDADDAWPPDVQRDMAQRLGARYEIVPGAAHSAPVENPAGLLPVLLGFWGLS